MDSTTQQPPGAPAADLDPARAYRPEAYTTLDDPVATWQAIARHQAAKDRALAPGIKRWFRPGRVLELGSGSGDLALLYRSLGIDMVASDYHGFFVEHHKKVGLEAYRIDATDIAASGVGQFPNVFCHSITPFITHDLAIVRAAYRSVLQTLAPGGRLVAVHAMEPYGGVAGSMRTHLAIARECGFADVKAFRNQIAPSFAYRGALRWPTMVVEGLLGKLAGVRYVLVATKAG